MKRLIVVLFVVLKANIAFDQNHNVNDSISEFLYNETYKNIAAFNIKYSVHSLNGVNKGNFLKTNEKFFYDAFISDINYKFKMDIKELSQPYPLNNYTLYQVFIDGFRYTKTNEDVEVAKGVIGGFPFSNYYLLALDKQNKIIKFISGQFFRNTISNDFSFDINNSDSFIEYLRLKTFCLQTKNLIFIKKRGKRLFYKSFSEELKKEIIIMLSLKDVENPIIIDAKK
ncbi:MAG: hypothetical protein PHV20_06285 [Bacteroidales bacterium]|nr:hypothetical protein [Bacteroidales bacterium]